jgi:hypothetical protein
MSALEKSLSVIDPHSISVTNAKLPAVYESAKLALAECLRVDECADWANKAQALASYAKQADDDGLYKQAVRIRARAIRRCGELLKTIENSKGGRPTQAARDAETTVASVPSFTRTQAARDAGLSERQQKTAVRVANVPAEQFESVVESEKPPTVTKIAKLGTKPKPLIDLNGRDSQDFRLSTQGQGALDRFVKMADSIDAGAVFRGASLRERQTIKKQVSRILSWLKNLEKQLEEK